jgi:thiamine biosynthesis protein ThiS
MKIILNNKEEYFEGNQLTISELLQIKKYTFRMLVIKVNGNLIRKGEFEKSFVKDGDDVMVLHLISGG